MVSPPQGWQLAGWPESFPQPCRARVESLSCGVVDGHAWHAMRPSPPMSQAKHGHPAGAFALQQRGWLLAKARNMCRNANDAEDLVQETLLRFIQTFERVESLPSERTCAAWMVTT